MVSIARGGARRRDSVRVGVELLRERGDVEVVQVHDAARPCASESLFEEVALEAARDRRHCCTSVSVYCGI